MNTATKIKYRLLPVVICVFVLFSVIFGGSYAALAETSTVTAYESQNVLDDLDGSTIAGEVFDLADYPYNENGQPQLLNFVEFAYSCYGNNQDDFGLYVYVYNPQGLAIDDNGSLNQIEVTICDLNPYKYDLEILNYSTAAGYEGLFYKFKVDLTDSERESVLNALDVSSRVYEISGIEISVSGTVTEYEVGATYTYTGYSLGYGSSLATESSLSCAVDGFDRYITLDVTHTTYRPEGDYYNGEQSQLDSVYFSVSNEYFENYGELTNIACEWYEYVTQPMLVTENVSIYNAMNSLYGQTLDNVSDGYDYLFKIYGTTDSSFFKKSVGSRHASNLTFADGESYSWYEGLTHQTVTFASDADFGGFGGVFYTGGESYDGYSVSSEEILAKLKSYSAKLGDASICGKYAAALFDSDYEGSGYSGLVDVKITDTKTLFTNYTSKAWWQYIFGGYSVETDYDGTPAIITFSESEYVSDYEGVNYTYDYLNSLDSSAVADLFYIGEADVDDFLASCKTAEKNDETIVLMRFASSTYISQPCAQARCLSSTDDSKTTLVKDCFSQWNDGDYSAYVFQETVYLNFDIISLTFTLDGVETVIPVVMSPIDLAGDSSSPLEEDITDWKATLKKILAVLAIVLLLILLFPVLPYVAQVIVWIISLPFKLIKSIAQAFKKSDKNKKE